MKITTCKVTWYKSIERTEKYSRWSIENVNCFLEIILMLHWFIFSFFWISKQIKYMSMEEMNIHLKKSTRGTENVIFITEKNEYYLVKSTCILWSHLKVCSVKSYLQIRSSARSSQMLKAEEKSSHALKFSKREKRGRGRNLIVNSFWLLLYFTIT